MKTILTLASVAVVAAALGGAASAAKLTDLQLKEQALGLTPLPEPRPLPRPIPIPRPFPDPVCLSCPPLLEMPGLMPSFGK